MAKLGDISSFHRWLQGLLFSSKGIHLLSHVFGEGNKEESPETFRFKCLYASLMYFVEASSLP